MFSYAGKTYEVVTRWTGTVNDLADVRRVREAFADHLAYCCEPNSDLWDAEMIFGELIANALRHGRCPVSAALCDDQDRPVLIVEDCGDGFPLPTRGGNELYSLGDAESGRGLLIVAQLAKHLNVEPINPFGCRVVVELPVRMRADFT